MKFAIGILLALAAWGAQASSDGCASPNEKVVDFFSRDDSGCGQDSLPFLDVNNSALANASLLLKAYDLEPSETELYAQPSWEAFQKYARDFYSRHQAPAPTDEKLTQWQSSYARWDLSCRTNSVDALKTFFEVLNKTAGLSAADAVALANMRLDVYKICGGTSANPDARKSEEQTLEKMRPKTTPGKDLGDYVIAAATLYSNDVDGAQKKFAALSSAQDAWVRESALYQVARCSMIKEMNRDLSADVLKDLAKKTEAQSLAYVKAYPNFLYTDSALGLLRRAYIDLGRESDYLRLLNEAMIRANRRKDRMESLRLSQELVRGPARWGASALDVKNALAVPYVVMHVLYLQSQADHALPPVDAIPETALAALSAAKSEYDPYPGLFELTRTALELATGHNDLAASDVPADTKLSSVVAISQRLLNAWALERQKNWVEARRVWHELLATKIVNADKVLRRRFEAGLARSYLRADDFDGLFKSSGPELSPYLSERILYQLGNGAKWEQIAFGKGWKPAASVAAQKMLLNQALREERFEDFHKIFDRSSEATRKLFASAKQGTDALQKNAEDPFGLLMVAGFLRHLEIDASYGYKSWTYYAGNFYKEFVSKVSAPKAPGPTPLAMYLSAAKTCEKKSCADFEAELLYQAITCFRGSGDGCIPLEAWEARQAVASETRQAWFTKLKKKYPESSWAKKLKFYW